MPERAPALILAFDFGLRRIGIASGSPITGIAAPRRTVTNGAAGPDWPAIDRELREMGPGLLLVGAPYNDDGSPGTLAPAATRFADELHARYRLPVERIDERYTSVEAASTLKAGRAAGTRGRRVVSGDIDSAAAAVMLDSYLRNNP
ncbi:MAG: Holliday junction resolvase RuvX [Steroidobacteraceae bacterium]